MVVLFRLLLSIFLGYVRRRIDPLDVSVINLRVYPNDIDLNVHMSSGRYISMMDIGRVEIFARMKILHTIMIGRRWRLIAGGSMIRYRRSLLSFERFQVTTRIVCWDEKWFYFEHIMERRGEVSAIGHVRALFRGPSGNIAPRDVLALTGRADPISPEMPAAIAKWREAEAAR